MSLKEAHESFLSNSRGPVHEDQRLQIEELDEWQTHKPRTHDKPKLRQDELNTFLNLLKVGDRVLLDVADLHIVTNTSNEEIPLTVISIFPFDIVEVIIPSTMSSSRGKKVAVPVSKKKKGASSSSGPTVETVMMNYDDPGTVQFCLSRLVRQLSVLEFGMALGFYTEEFKEENDLHALHCHIYRSLSRFWDTLVLDGAPYNLSHSKASALPPSLRYLHAILAHTITGRRESTGVVNTHNACFLWHVIDLAYCIALAIQHQTERHRKGYKDPPTQPPPPSRPVHAVASYADISERLT
ncbi:hypothetical protein GOBAR_AA11204 [Gossypium barbadense]|uniref:Arabidopsis retrotransposon Orf1 C-terminal domain-containing protein n=1 Tax=Gossypium barbadense TaxID=3634 RepID=A0A2P5Y1G8_GOSBA|nr:hypothetical protein GOBAR_AA11204 [Gossypium barbadense]